MKIVNRILVAIVCFVTVFAFIGTDPAEAKGGERLVLQNGTWYYEKEVSVEYWSCGHRECHYEWRRDSSKTGFVSHQGNLFYVENGAVRNNKNGVVKDNSTGVWYFCANSRVCSEFTGVTFYDGTGYYVVRGVWQNTFSGRAAYNGKPCWIGSGKFYSFVY